MSLFLNRVFQLLTATAVPATLLVSCSSGPWNNPYAGHDAAGNIHYSSFSERPKHLDPVRSYSSNEYAFIAQIYEPPLQYHYLKRPYALVPLTAVEMPSVRYFGEHGETLSSDAPATSIAVSEYEIRIAPGIEYQPHPAFAISPSGNYRYHQLGAARLNGVHTLADFEHTGSRELVAEDYVYQIKRLANPKLHSPIAGLMSEYIIGFHELRAAIEQKYSDAAIASNEAPYIDLRELPLEGVRATDRYTYRIRLRGKYPQFVYWLAMPFFAPMPWEAERFYTQAGMSERNITLHWYPVGTGPYMLTENNPNLRMVLERNPNFHGERYPSEGEPRDVINGLLADGGRQLPLIKTAIYSLEKENIPYWNKFLQGYYDASGITSDSFDQAIQFSAGGDVELTEIMEAKGIELSTAVTTSISYMGFNMRDPVVGGDSERARLLRRAIAITVDYEELISIFANGRGVAAQGPIPPGIFGYLPGERGINSYVYDWKNGTPRRKPLAAARTLLAEAGYPQGIDSKTGKPLVLYFDTTATGPDDKARLNWLRKQFDKLGVQLVIRATDYNRFQEKMLKGSAQIYQWGWNADYPDPENFLFLLYGPNAKVVNNGENASNYENPAYDRLFDVMKNMENGPNRQKVIDEMVEILRWDAPWLFGFHPKSFALHHEWYRNVKPNLMANNTLKYKRIDPGQRARKRAQWNQPVLWPLGLVGIVLVVGLVPAVFTFWRREQRTAL